MEGGDDNNGMVNPFGLQDIISMVLALDPQVRQTERERELQAEISNKKHSVWTRVQGLHFISDGNNGVINKRRY